MYSILVKDKANLYRFLTVKKNVTKEETKEVTDEGTQEVKTETILVPTGETEVVIYTAETKDELEEKCVELLNSYKATDFIPVDTMEYTTDLIWKEKTE